MPPACMFVALFILTAAAPLPAAERYAAQLQDGTRVEETEVRAWHDVDAKPTIVGKPLFDAGNPVRWIIDRRQPPGPPAAAFIEFAGGDRLAGTVVGAQTGQEDPYDQRPPHLFVRPAAEWQFPDDKQSSDLRVRLEWVQRIVWQRSGSEAYRPGTARLLDGAEVLFRSLRWDQDQLRLLTSDGVRAIAWDDLAELHLPKLDAWNSYLDQLATLSPACGSRIIQLETTDGSRCTTSAERFRPRNWGDVNKPETWYQLMQPAWSLDPLWVRYRKIRTWRFWQPDVVPLTTIAPAGVEQRSAFGSGWTWQVDRNVRRELLQSAELDFGGGFGVQASTDLRFDYPPFARAVRTQAGLDRSSGDGGCVTLSVLDGAAKALFQTEHLIGSTRVLDTGWLDLPPEDGSPRQLVLRADMDHAQRPAGADPLDIRDAVNWYEPELRLDLPLLQAEVARRGWTRLPGRSGWTVGPEDAAKIQIVNSLSPYDPRRPEFRLKFLVKDRFVAFSRTMKIEPQHRWLVAVLTRDQEQTTPASVQVRVDGQVLGDFDVPLRQGPLEPDPILAPLDGLPGKTATVELVFQPHGEQSLVDWKGVSLAAGRPGVRKLFEDEKEVAAQFQSGGRPMVTLSADRPFSGTHSLRVSPTSAENSRLTGLDAWIAEQPRNGQFRYLVFAWRKEGGSRITLQLAHDGRFAEQLVPPLDPRQRLEDRGLRTGFAYDAGSATPGANAPLRLDAKLPDQWTLVTRDLFADFGPLNLTGLSLGSPDGTAAWFDHIYLARTPQDVEFLRTHLVNGNK